MTELNLVTQVIVSGLAVGFIYGIVALGFVLIFKASGVINFAHGEILLLGAFFAYTFIVYLHVPYWIAFLCALIVMAIFGGFLERLIIRRLIGEPVFTIVMLTIGLSIFIRSVVGMTWGYDSYGFVTPFTNKSITLGNIVISLEQISIIGMVLLLIIILVLFFNFTKTGISMLATAQNQLAAAYMGISVNRVFSKTWILGAVIAGIAGILLSPITFVHVNMGFIAMKAFPAAILGGFGSVPGALVGGLIIGVIESLAGVYMPEGWKDVIAYVILIAVLIIKPSGIFATHAKKKV